MLPSINSHANPYFPSPSVPDPCTFSGQADTIPPILPLMSYSTSTVTISTIFMFNMSKSTQSILLHGHQADCIQSQYSSDYVSFFLSLTVNPSIPQSPLTYRLEPVTILLSFNVSKLPYPNPF